MDIVFIISFMLVLFSVIGLLISFTRTNATQQYLINDLRSRGDNLYKQSTHPKEDIMALNLSRTEFYKTLNFLLLMGVIDFNQYTELEQKALSFLKA